MMVYLKQKLNPSSKLPCFYGNVYAYEKVVLANWSPISYFFFILTKKKQLKNLNFDVLVTLETRTTQ